MRIRPFEDKYFASRKLRMLRTRASFVALKRILRAEYGPSKRHHSSLRFRVHGHPFLAIVVTLVSMRSSIPCYRGDLGLDAVIHSLLRGDLGLSAAASFLD